MSVLGGVVITAFGIFWTVMAASMSGGFGGGFSFFPLFGVLVIFAGAGMSIYSYSKAGQYEEAHRRYQCRRALLLEGRAEAGLADEEFHGHADDDGFRAADGR